MKKEYLYQVISEEKSSPVGIDWLMIMAAKSTIQEQRYFQKPTNEIDLLLKPGKPRQEAFDI